MELLLPTSFASVVACSKEQLKNISVIVSRYCGEDISNDFLEACSNVDFVKVNSILDQTIKELTGDSSVSMALRNYIEKFPQLSPQIDDDFSNALSEAEKVLAINKYSDDIINILEGKL